jgi:hypothetical protein
MKPLLALVALGLTTLIFEERARQVAGDVHQTYNDIVTQVSEAKQTVTEKVERQPIISLLIAGGLAYMLASIVPGRN